MKIIDVLRNVRFGERVAEEEADQLASYFVETDHWRRLFTDEVDIVYGSKGAGKSALYSLLIAKRDALFDRGILVAPAENPRGAPAFKDLVGNPPASERDFLLLWKLYLASVLSQAIDDFGVSDSSATELRNRLQASGLRPTRWSLQAALRSALEYVKRLSHPESFEAGLNLNAYTQTPIGVTGKITFSEPSPKEAAEGAASVDQLLQLADQALQGSKYVIWITLDRLDVAFLDSPDLEQNALRALFHAYLDLMSLRNVRLKIFLRTDIWQRITTAGFREASHITRHLTIDWNRGSLLNLVMRRALKNLPIIEYYSVSPEQVLSSTDAQEQFFYRIFPNQVEVGDRKPNTLDWMLGRTCDAFRHNAPRELIHLLNSLREVQTRKLEVGDPEPEGNRLFTRSVFKDALPEVSRVRLEQTVYAEYPAAREPIESLRGQKTQHTLASLAAIWRMEEQKALSTAKLLAEIGIFEVRGHRDAPIFWVPLLYRDGLELVQGAADA